MHLQDNRMKGLGRPFGYIFRRRFDVSFWKIVWGLLFCLRSFFHVELSARLKSRSRQGKSGRRRSLRRISTRGRLAWLWLSVSGGSFLALWLAFCQWCGRSLKRRSRRGKDCADPKVRLAGRSSSASSRRTPSKYQDAPRCTITRAEDSLERERWIRFQQVLAPSGFQKLDADSNLALVGRSSSATWRRRASK